MTNTSQKATDPCLDHFMRVEGLEADHAWRRLAANHVIPVIESVLSRRFGFPLVLLTPPPKGHPHYEDAMDIALETLESVRCSAEACKANPDGRGIYNFAGLVRKRTNQRFVHFLMKERPEFFMARSDMLLLARRRHLSLFSIWSEGSIRTKKVFGLLVWKHLQPRRNDCNWNLFFTSTETAIASMLRASEKELESSGLQSSTSWIRGSAWHFYLLLVWLGDKVPLNDTARCLSGLACYRTPKKVQVPPPTGSPRFFREDLSSLASEWALVREMNIDYRRSYLLSISNHGVCPLLLYLHADVLSLGAAASAVGLSHVDPEEFKSLTNVEIARLFGMSESTVHVYRHRVRERLLRTRT